MRKLLLCACLLFSVSLYLNGFSLNANAEESTGYFYPSPSNYLTSEQQEWVCDNWDIVSVASYVFSYQDSNQLVVVTGWNGSSGKLWRLKPDGTYLNDGTAINYVFTDPNNIAAIYVDTGNYLGQGIINNLEMIDICSAFPNGFAGCPVALNDVISNDYIASLLTYTYMIEDEKFIIWRVQETYDVSGLPNTIDIKEIGEIKGYILTTDNYIVRTFVTEYNRPTILSSTNGETWTYQYMDILDPHFDNEMVLHYSCLDTRFSSEFEALESVNSSIQSTIQQNATLIAQNESIIEQNEQIIAKQEETNNLLANMFGNDENQEILGKTEDLLEPLADGTGVLNDIEFESSFLMSILEVDGSNASIEFPGFSMMAFNHNGNEEPLRFWESKRFYLSDIEDNFPFLVSSVRQINSILCCLFTYRSVNRVWRKIFNVN